MWIYIRREFQRKAYFPLGLSNLTHTHTHPYRGLTLCQNLWYKMIDHHICVTTLEHKQWILKQVEGGHQEGISLVFNVTLHSRAYLFFKRQNSHGLWWESKGQVGNIRAQRPQYQCFCSQVREAASRSTIHSLEGHLISLFSALLIYLQLSSAWNLIQTA